jgi:hypothetical protein
MRASCTGNKNKKRNATMNSAAEINIIVMNQSGDIVRTVTLDELGSTGQNFQIWLLNWGVAGSTDYELCLQDEPTLMGLIDQGRRRRGELALSPCVDPNHL